MQPFKNHFLDLRTASVVNAVGMQPFKYHYARSTEHKAKIFVMQNVIYNDNINNIF